MTENPMERYLQRFPPPDDLDKEEQLSRTEKTSPRRLAVEESLDLHGYRLEEARNALSRFIQTSADRGVRKVLVIHGKGSHADSGAVIKKMVKEELAKNGRVGATGTPGAREGGTGATWAVLRVEGQRSR